MLFRSWGLLLLLLFNCYSYSAAAAAIRLLQLFGGCCSYSVLFGCCYCDCCCSCCCCCCYCYCRCSLGLPGHTDCICSPLWVGGARDGGLSIAIAPMTGCSKWRREEGSLPPSPRLLLSLRHLYSSSSLCPFYTAGAVGNASGLSRCVRVRGSTTSRGESFAADMRSRGISVCCGLTRQRWLITKMRLFRARKTAGRGSPAPAPCRDRALPESACASARARAFAHGPRARALIIPPKSIPSCSPFSQVSGNASGNSNSNGAGDGGDSEHLRLF